VPTEKELAGKNYIQQAKLWQKRKYDAGWACITWPKEYGGRGASAIEQVIWNQEESKFEGLPGGVFGIGQGMAAPTLMTWATMLPRRATCRSWPAARRSGVSCSRAGRRLRPGGAAHPRGQRR
jgi:alkylation response protein AidB-like acyl-CoA dehydrogenase